MHTHRCTSTHVCTFTLSRSFTLLSHFQLCPPPPPPLLSLSLSLLRSLPLPPSPPPPQYNGEAGDVIVVLQQMDHAVYRRQGIDLYVDKKISLREALCGYQFRLDHLDGRVLWVKSDEHDVLSPGWLAKT